MISNQGRPRSLAAWYVIGALSFFDKHTCIGRGLVSVWWRAGYPSTSIAFRDFAPIPVTKTCGEAPRSCEVVRIPAVVISRHLASVGKVVFFKPPLPYRVPSVPIHARKTRPCDIQRALIADTIIWPVTFCAGAWKIIRSSYHYMRGSQGPNAICTEIHVRFCHYNGYDLKRGYWTHIASMSFVPHGGKRYTNCGYWQILPGHPLLPPSYQRNHHWRKVIWNTNQNMQCYSKRLHSKALTFATTKHQFWNAVGHGNQYQNQNQQMAV